MTDLLFTATPDGGEIVMENGQFVLCDGKYAAVYLSLFGGNDDDSGLEGDDRKQWWGNMDETVPERRYRSETQHALKAAPLIPASLTGFEDAAKRDLAWMEQGIADDVEAVATMPRVNKVDLDIEVTIDGDRVPFDFNETRPEEL